MHVCSVLLPSTCPIDSLGNTLSVHVIEPCLNPVVLWLNLKNPSRMLKCQNCLFAETLCFLLHRNNFFNKKCWPGMVCNHANIWLFSCVYFNKTGVSPTQQGQVVRKPVNANPGLKINRGNSFSCIKVLSIAYVLCSLRLLMFKTEGQKIETELLAEKLQKLNQNSR